MGWRFKREWTSVYLWLIHVDVWQKPIQDCKVVILQLKKNFFNFKRKEVSHQVYPTLRKRPIRSHLLKKVPNHLWTHF